MTIAVRNELAEWIRQSRDEELLETLMLIKDSSKGDWFTDLSKQQRKSIERGIVDHEKGNTLTSKEFWDKHGR